MYTVRKTRRRGEATRVAKKARKETVSVQAEKEQVTDPGVAEATPETSTGGTINPPPIVSVEDDLGVHVPQAIRSKITNGEYVNLACFPDIAG